MMRLVVLLSAEERGLFLLGDPLYDQHYAASTLMAQQREMADQAGEEVLERRDHAWSRLLATFRACSGRGCAHARTCACQPMAAACSTQTASPSWKAGSPAPVAKRPLTPSRSTTARCCIYWRRCKRSVKVPGGGPAEARRLSFALPDIEQIGHVYEGLLDHHAIRAAEPASGLAGVRDSEPEIALATLEGQAARPEQVLLDYIRNDTPVRRTPSRTG